MGKRIQVHVSRLLVAGMTVGMVFHALASVGSGGLQRVPLVDFKNQHDASLASFANAYVASCSGGRLQISNPQLNFGLRIVYPHWLGQANPDGSILADEDGVRRFDFAKVQGNSAVAKAKGSLRIFPNGQGGVNVVYGLELPESIMTPQIGLQAEIPTLAIAGGALIVDGQCIPIPRVSQKPVFNGKLRTVEFRDSSGCTLIAFAFERRSVFTLMERTKDGPRGYTVRIPFFEGGTLSAGTFLEKSFTISGRRPFAVDDGVKRVCKAGPNWIPLMPDDDILTGSACDYSGLRGAVKPCGTYGRVVAKGSHFEFEECPGHPVRFYGANVCCDACFVERHEADRLVGLLSRAGYNAVRLHHYDRALTRDSADATVLDPVRLARLDYFLSRCYAAGLYVTTDFFIGRVVPRKAVGLGEKGGVSQLEFKSQSFTNALLRANFKTYIGNFLNHVNPHTGRRYADEPGLFAIAFVNEGTPEGRSSEDARRLAEMEACSAEDLKRFVRETVKSKVLLSNMSNGWSPAAYQLPRLDVYDYVDSHFYVDHPQFPEKHWDLPWLFANENSIRNPVNHGLPKIALTRLLDRPFVSTEYNYTAPNRFRMAGALLTGAAAAAQDWSGVWRFEWTMNTNDATRLDFPVPFHATGFDTPGDPLQLVGEGLFAALFLRGDLAPFRTVAALAISRRAVKESKSAIEPDLKNHPILAAGWRTRIGTLVTDGRAPEGMRTWRYPKALEEDSGQLIAGLPLEPRIAVDRKRGSFAVSTPRTCAVFAEEGRMEAGALIADIQQTPAAVWTISLDGRPLAETRRALLVHATNVQSTGMPYARVGKLYVFGHGRLPFLMARGRAEVSLDVGRPFRADDAKWTVYALSPGGRRLRTMPCFFGNDGRLRISCDTAANPSQATFLYELIR